VWETATGTCRSELVGHSRAITAVVFLADGQELASASEDTTVQKWEMATGRRRSILECSSSYVTAVVFSPDEQLVASVSRDKTVRVWETATGTCCSMLESPSSYSYHHAFSPNSQVLHTDKGDITLPLSLYLTPSVQQDEQPLYFLVEDQWVLHNTQRLLWLPFEYRAYRTAVYKDMVCLGCPSGRVALLRLRPRCAQERCSKTACSCVTIMNA
jgi:WD40 repeat protein